MEKFINTLIRFDKDMIEQIITKLNKNEKLDEIDLFFLKSWLPAYQMFKRKKKEERKKNVRK